MNRTLLSFGTALLFLPLLFSIWLLVAVQLPRMDVVTAHVPASIQSMVGTGIARLYPLGKGSEARARATRFNTAAVHDYDAREASVHLLLDGQRRRGSTKQFEIREGQTIEVNSPENEAEVRTLLAQGHKAEQDGDFCAAESVYTQASSRKSSSSDYVPAEQMGRAGLRCKDLSGARAALEVAVEKEGRSLDEVGDGDGDEIQRDMLADREYLMVVYSRQHEQELLDSTCRQAHAGWHGCACTLQRDGAVACHDLQRGSR